MKRFNHEEYEDGKLSRLIYLFGALFFVIFLYFTLGCATRYQLIVHEDGRIEATSRSYREFTYFKMQYNPETHFFEVVAIGVTDDTAEVVTASVETVGGIAENVLPLMLRPVP